MREYFDFPKELRFDSLVLKESHPYTADMIGRAAAEIERLRAALEQIDAAAVSKKVGAAVKMQRIAREALEMIRP